jgi:hypothetical protein
MRCMQSARILVAARIVRAAIEGWPKHQLPIQFQAFPAGACGDSALILGTYLEEQCALGDFEYVSAERGTRSNDSWTSHAWLRCGSLVVDITADQFADAPSGVIVAVDSEWHKSFQIVQCHTSNIKVLPEVGSNELSCFYDQMITSLKSRGTDFSLNKNFKC